MAQAAKGLAQQTQPSPLSESAPGSGTPLPLMMDFMSHLVESMLCKAMSSSPGFRGDTAEFPSPAQGKEGEAELGGRAVCADPLCPSGRLVLGGLGPCCPDQFLPRLPTRDKMGLLKLPMLRLLPGWARGREAPTPAWNGRGRTDPQLSSH